MNLRFAAALALALLLAACGGFVDPSKNQIETFTGILAPGGYNGSHIFNVSKSGEFSVTMSSMAPSNSAAFGMAFAQQTPGCNLNLLQVNNSSVVGRVSIGGQIQPGSYCIAVFDVGTIVVPQSYTFTVSHP